MLSLLQGHPAFRTSGGSCPLYLSQISSHAPCTPPSVLPLPDPKPVPCAPPTPRPCTLPPAPHFLSAPRLRLCTSPPAPLPYPAPAPALALQGPAGRDRTTVGEGPGRSAGIKATAPSPATPSPCRAAAHLLLCHNVFQSGEANCPIRAGASGFHLCRRLINMLLLAAADKFQKQVVKGFCLYPAWKIRGVTSRNMNRWPFSFLLLSSPSPCSAKRARSPECSCMRVYV